MEAVLRNPTGKGMVGGGETSGEKERSKAWKGGCFQMLGDA